MAEATEVKTKKQFHLRFVFDFERTIEAETAEEAKEVFEKMVEEQWSPRVDVDILSDWLVKNNVIRRIYWRSAI